MNNQSNEDRSQSKQPLLPLQETIIRELYSATTDKESTFEWKVEIGSDDYQIAFAMITAWKERFDCYPLPIWKSKTDKFGKTKYRGAFSSDVFFKRGKPLDKTADIFKSYLG